MSRCHVVLGADMKIVGRLQCLLCADDTEVKIGNGCMLGSVNILIDHPNVKVSVGDACLFGYDVSFRTGDGHTIYDMNTGEILNFPKDIVVGNHVWVGRHVTLLKNARIGNDCVVGLGSVVNKQFKENHCILAGIPARIVKRDCSWDIRNVAHFASYKERIREIQKRQVMFVNELPTQFNGSRIVEHGKDILVEAGDASYRYFKYKKLLAHTVYSMISGS